MSKRQSDIRNIKRHGEKGDTQEHYIDNRGQEYDYKWVAKVASLINFISGGFQSGFPVLVNKLRYPAWAFYPMFFIRRDLKVENPIHILNHERIHIKQQRELIGAITPLLIILAFLGSWAWVLLIPFIPTVAYWLNVIYVIITCGKILKYSEIRRRTCFEIEAERFASDKDYLLHRKVFHNLRFLNYKPYTE